MSQDGACCPYAGAVNEPTSAREVTRPVQVDTARIMAAGIGCWALALVVTLVVPSLHSGERDWWPWACITGLVIGIIGLAYIRRGRGNAAGGRTG